MEQSYVFIKHIYIDGHDICIYMYICIHIVFVSTDMSLLYQLVVRKMQVTYILNDDLTKYF